MTISDYAIIKLRPRTFELERRRPAFTVTAARADFELDLGRFEETFCLVFFNFPVCFLKDLSRFGVYSDVSNTGKVLFWQKDTFLKFVWTPYLQCFYGLHVCGQYIACYYTEH